jgi:hypothetical protein
MVMIAARKAANLIRHEMAGKRDAALDASVPLAAIERKHALIRRIWEGGDANGR